MFKILKKLEDPHHPLLGPNIKALKCWGLIVSKNVWTNVLHFILHFISISFIAMQYINTWYVKYDVILLSNNIKYAIMSSVSVGKIAMFHYHQKDWGNIMEYVTRADIYQRTTKDISRTRKMNASTAYCRKLTYCYWMLFYSVAFMSSALPVVKFFSSETYRESVKNGTRSYLEIYPCWTPFNKNTIPGHFATLAYQSLAATHGGGWITSFDTFVLVIMVFFRVELELLREDFAKIFGDDLNPVERDDVIVRLKECHRRQVELKKYSNLFDSCVSPIMLIYTFVCSVMLCLALNQMSIETDLIEKVNVIPFLMFCVMQLFTICWHSNQVFYASQDLRLGPYESKWYNEHAKYRRSLHILMAQCDRPIVFTVGPFATLSVSTFINILKGAYSYYSFLNQSQTN